MPPRELPKTPRTSSVDEAARVGLCVICRHARPIVSAKGSSFWLCGLAQSEPGRFPKYPRLPVRQCAGFER